MSYRKKHLKSKIHRIKPRRSIFKTPWFWMGLFFLIIIFSILYLVVFYSGVQVENIVISGNHKISSKEIEGLVLNNINNKILQFGEMNINSKSIFLVNNNKLSTEILNKFSTIEIVTINRKLPKTLFLNIQERSPVAVFCPSQDRQNCYPIDSNGIIFDPIDSTLKELPVIVQIIDQTSLPVGERVVEQNIMNLFINVRNNLENKFQIGVKEMLIVSLARINIETDDGWKIYFDLISNSNVDAQILKLRLLIENEVPESERSNLKYIDLRPKGRAIVCNNQTCGNY